MGQITIKTDLPLDRDYVISDAAQAIEIIKLLNKTVGYPEIQILVEMEKLEDAQDVADAISILRSGERTYTHKEVLEMLNV